MYDFMGSSGAEMPQQVVSQALSALQGMPYAMQNQLHKDWGFGAIPGVLAEQERVGSEAGNIFSRAGQARWDNAVANPPPVQPPAEQPVPGPNHWARNLNQLQLEAVNAVAQKAHMTPEKVAALLRGGVVSLEDMMSAYGLGTRRPPQEEVPGGFWKGNWRVV
jgi:hypothetical protein